MDAVRGCDTLGRSRLSCVRVTAGADAPFGAVSRVVRVTIGATAPAGPNLRCA